MNLSLHWPAFQQELISTHVWRQTETQTVIENFYQEDFNILNPRKNSRGSTEGFHRKEFPIMQWTFAGVHQWLGSDITITRALSYLVSLLSVLGIFRLTDLLFKNKILAALTAWAFSFTPSFYYYAVAPLPDNFALMGAIWAWVFFLLALRGKAILWYSLMALALSLSFAAKLPYLVFYGLPAFILLFKYQPLNITGSQRKFGILVLTISLIPPILWYIWVIPSWEGNPILTGILSGENLNQSGAYFWHHLISTLPELLLNYGNLLFFLLGLFLLFNRKLYKNPLVQGLAVSLLGMFLYFGFEINAIAKVHDYYLLPFLPLLFLVVTQGIQLIWRLKFGPVIALIFLSVLPLTAALRMNHRWDPATPGFNADLLTYRTQLRTAVPDTALVVAGNDVSTHIFLYHLHKKGWTFSDDYLPPQLLQKYIGEGAQYLYTDAKAVKQNAEIQALVTDTVLQAGSFSVYRLKP